MRREQVELLGGAVARSSGLGRSDRRTQDDVAEQAGRRLFVVLRRDAARPSGRTARRSGRPRPSTAGATRTSRRRRRPPPTAQPAGAPSACRARSARGSRSARRRWTRRTRRSRRRTRSRPPRLVASPSTAAGAAGTAAAAGVGTLLAGVPTAVRLDDVADQPVAHDVLARAAGRTRRRRCPRGSPARPAARCVVPPGRSTCVTSPVTTIFEPNPSRVRNIFICSGEVFCASSRMMNASFKRPASHVRQRCDLDRAGRHQPRDRLRVDHVVQRVVERAQVRVDLLEQRAGQEARAARPPRPRAGSG